MTKLSEKQIEAIIETWKIPASAPIDSAEAILYAFFEKFPQNQQKFYKFKNVPLADLKVINFNILELFIINGYF